MVMVTGELCTTWLVADLKALGNLGAHVPGLDSSDVQLQIRHASSFAQQVLALAGLEVCH